MAVETKRDRYLKLLGQMKTERGSFESHWTDISSFIMPRRLRLSKENRNKGNKVNQNIIDSTATQAAGVLRAGMMSGMTSPSRPWFQFGLQDASQAKFGPVANYLTQCRDIIASMLLRSNFYHSVPLLYGDAGVFGTGAMGQFENGRDVVRFRPYPLGEYWIANDNDLQVRTFIREFQMTVRQVVEEFGQRQNGTVNWSNFSTTIKSMWQNGDYESWVDVCHVIQKNTEADPGKLHSKYLPWYECYFESGQNVTRGDTDIYLREKGYHEFPIMVARWEVTAGDVYGTSCPGMVALGDVKQLQMGEKIASNALDKMVRPPMLAPNAFLNAKVSTLPGEWTYGDTTDKNQVRPLIDTSSFRVDLLEAKQERIRSNINEAFFRPLFQMLSDMDVKDVTATAISELKEEKLLLLGPVYGQFDQDVLKPLIDRSFAMAERAGMLPEAPQEIQGQSIEVEYISAMAQAMKAVGTAGIDRFAAFTLQWAAADPSVLAKVDQDKLIERYADGTGVPPDIIRDQDTTDGIRQQQSQAAAQQQGADTLKTGAEAAQALGNTPLDQNSALAALMGGNQGQPVA